MGDETANGRASDPRIDKAVSWLLTTIAAVALGWLATEVRSMNDKIEKLTVQAAVVEAAKYGDRIDKLEARIQLVERERAAGSKQ